MDVHWIPLSLCFLVPHFNIYSDGFFFLPFTVMDFVSLLCFEYIIALKKELLKNNYCEYTTTLKSLLIFLFTFFSLPPTLNEVLNYLLHIKKPHKKRLNIHVYTTICDTPPHSSFHFCCSKAPLATRTQPGLALQECSPPLPQVPQMKQSTFLCHQASLFFCYIKHG